MPSNDSTRLVTLTVLLENSRTAYWPSSIEYHLDKARDITSRMTSLDFRDRALVICAEIDDLLERAKLKVEAASHSH